MAFNLVVPGLGTIQAGRRYTGGCQMVLALAGLAMSFYFGGWFLLEWKRSGVLPMTTIATLGQTPEGWLLPLFVGVIGILLFGAALGWAFISSLGVRRQQERR